MDPSSDPTMPAGLSLSSLPRWVVGVATLVVLVVLTLVVTSISKAVYDEDQELEPAPTLDAEPVGESGSGTGGTPQPGS